MVYRELDEEDVQSLEEEAFRVLDEEERWRSVKVKEAFRGLGLGEDGAKRKEMEAFSEGEGGI